MKVLLQWRCMHIIPPLKSGQERFVLGLSALMIWFFCFTIAAFAFAIQWGPVKIQLLDGDFHIPLLLMSYLGGGFLGLLAASWFIASQVSMKLKELLIIDALLFALAYFASWVTAKMGHDFLLRFVF